jgi:hypothetical protein
LTHFLVKMSQQIFLFSRWAADEKILLLSWKESLMHRIFRVRSVAVMAACFSLAACVSVKMDGNLTVAAKQDKGVTRQQRGAVSGQRQLLGGWFNLLADCTSGGYPTLNILSAPEHGRVSVEQEVGVPLFDKNDSRSACSQKSFPGSKLYYTSEAGFTGTDRLEFERIGVQGAYEHYDYTINVR